MGAKCTLDVYVALWCVQAEAPLSEGAGANVGRHG
jgi:hypothetical protein